MTRPIERATAAIPTAEHPEEFYKAARRRARDPGHGRGRPARSGRGPGPQRRGLQRGDPSARQLCGSLSLARGDTVAAGVAPEESMADLPGRPAHESGGQSGAGGHGHRLSQGEQGRPRARLFRSCDRRGSRQSPRPDESRVDLPPGRTAWSKGRRDLERAIKINPRHLAAQYNLSVALYKQGELNAALKRLDEIPGAASHLRAGPSRFEAS